VCYDAWRDFLVEPFCCAIVYVDPDVAGKRVGENHTQIFSWHWTGDDELRIPIITSIVYLTMLSIVNTVITSLPDSSQTIQKHWGCWDKLNDAGGPHRRTVTPIFDNNTAAGWVPLAMKLKNQILF